MTPPTVRSLNTGTRPGPVLGGVKSWASGISSEASSVRTWAWCWVRAMITSVLDPWWGTIATAVSDGKIEVSCETLTPSALSADPSRESSGPIPPATPATVPALSTDGAIRSRP